MGIFFILAIIAGVGSLIWMGIAAAAKRTKELAALAPTFNFAFDPGPFQPGGGPFVGAGSFPVFNEGFSRKITNVLHGRVDDAEVQVFDYRYTTHSTSTDWNSSRNSTSNTQQHHSFTTLVFTKSAGPSFPNMQVYPENIFSKIGAAFGGQDIDFAEFPEFSKRFVLKSPDEQTVRAIFDAPTVAFFEANLGITVHANGPYLLFYRASKIVRPTEARQFLDTGVYLYRTLGAAVARLRR